MEQHDGEPSPSSIPTAAIEDSSAQNAPKGTVNDFALRVPPPAQRAGDQAHLRIVSEQQKELRRVRNGVLEATEQVIVPHSLLGQLWYHTKRILIGPPLATESSERERLTKVKALAVLASDAISSVAYATEAIVFTLAAAGSGHLGLTLPISMVIIALLAIVAISYRQTIPAYPNGGGSYIVAKENLGTVAGLVAAAALLIDYVLNVAVSVAAGVLNLASLFPILSPYIIALDVALVVLITLINLRGVRESGSILAFPTYFFVATAMLLIIVGIIKAFVVGHKTQGRDTLIMRKAVPFAYATPNTREEVTDMQEKPKTYIEHEKPITLPGAVSPVPAVMPRVLIVGAGFGGLQAARALRNVPVQVTVIDRKNHHLFQPLLYQVATAVLSPAEISAPIRGVLHKQKNTEVLLAEVTGVDTQAQRVLLDDDQSVPYDYLILATGARDSYFGHNDWEQFAPGLKSIVQATAIRSKILLAFEMAERETDPEKRKALLTFVLVGAGPTGVEMAGAIATLANKTLVSDFRHINPKQARIVLVEALPRILMPFDERLAKKAHKALNRLGVEVRTNAPVEAIDSEGVVITGERLPAKTVIWTAGVAASPAGQWLGAETDRAGRVKVGSDASVPNLTYPPGRMPNIFVIGDTASFTQDGKPLPGVAQVAIQQGQYVASVIADRVAGKPHPEAFRYVDKGSMATIGGFYAIVSIGKFRIAGLLGWFMWLFVHLMYLIGYRNRLVVGFQWLVYLTTFQRGAQLITSGDEIDS